MIPPSNTNSLEIVQLLLEFDSLRRVPFENMVNNWFIRGV
jgi:hypothetical protein